MIKHFLCASLMVLLSQSVVADEEPTLRKPSFVDGQPVMPRDDWVHNFKISSVPGLCTNPEAGFALVYKGNPEDCYLLVRSLIDMCMDGPLDNKIPQTIRGFPMAHTAGENLGRCVLDAYLVSSAGDSTR